VSRVCFLSSPFRFCIYSIAIFVCLYFPRVVSCPRRPRPTRARPYTPSASAPHTRLPKATSHLPNAARPETSWTLRRSRAPRAGPPVRSLSFLTRRPEATVPRCCPFPSSVARGSPLFKADALFLAQARRALRLARPQAHHGCRRGTSPGVLFEASPTTPVPCLAPTRHTRHARSPDHAAPSPERVL
jgi:hypothetical protein